MVFSIPQLEYISRTIFQYELRPLPLTKEIAACHAAIVFATGEPSPLLSWALNTRLGALPVDLHLENTSNNSDHLLDFVAAFEDRPDVRDAFLGRLKKELASHTFDSTKGRIYYSAREIPPPTYPSLRLTEVRPHLFHPLHAAWYTPRALAKLAHAHLTYQSGVATFLWEIGETLERSNQSTAVLEKVATHAALKELASRPAHTTDYVSIAQAVALGDPAPLVERFRALDNVYRILAVALRDPPKDVMIGALRALATSKKLEVLAYLGRAPTLEELLASNVRGAARIWRLMPWEIFGPIVKEHGTSLRGALIKRVEMPHEELKQCLINHEERIPLASSRGRPTKGADRFRNLDSAQGFRAFAASVRQYDWTATAREVLRASYPLDVVKLIALRHLTRREDLADYVDPVITDFVRETLAKCAVTLPSLVKKQDE